MFSFRRLNSKYLASIFTLVMMFLIISLPAVTLGQPAGSSNNGVYYQFYQFLPNQSQPSTFTDFTNQNTSNSNVGPTVSNAYEQFGDAGGLVPCDGIKTKCDFIAFVKMLNRIMSWLIGIATLVFTLTLIYGGFLYLTSGDKPANKDKAKSMMWSTLIGFVIILTAWLIVHTILDYLVPSGTPGKSYIFKFIGN